MVEKRVLTLAAITGAWLPVFVAWVIFTATYSGMGVGQATLQSAITVGSAAALGALVPIFCAAVRWPKSLRPPFYFANAAASIVYACAWVTVIYAVDAFLTGRGLWRMLWSSRVLGWQLIMGVWLYCAIAAITYAMQTHHLVVASEMRASRAEADSTRARLDALRNRLHPHFLFNALHTVAALVRRDANEAESAVEQLGEILRYTLREENDMVPFADEWAFTLRYIDFEQIRFGDRLRVCATIDPACVNWSTPTFALQTLIENAVQHSIARRDGGRVEINARRAGECLAISVRDDGGAAVTSTHEGYGLGLSALQERLHGIYGDDAHLSVRSEETGFEAVLLLPAGGDFS